MTQNTRPIVIKARDEHSLLRLKRPATAWLRTDTQAYVCADIRAVCRRVIRSKVLQKRVRTEHRKHSLNLEK